MLIKNSGAKVPSGSPVCKCCGLAIDGLPAFGTAAPEYWQDSLEQSDESVLTPDICIINNEHYFLRCTLQIPITDTSDTFDYGLWASISRESFEKYIKVYGKRKEKNAGPYFGWLANNIRGYADCLEIKCNVQPLGNKLRPLLLLDHENTHTLCQQQHNGITLQQAHKLAAKLLKQSRV